MGVAGFDSVAELALAMIPAHAGALSWEQSVARGDDPEVDGPALLVVDSSYSFETLSLRKQLESVTCRDLDGFFAHVWTVHPLATLVTSSSWTSKYGRPVTHEINKRHTFIEGKIGRFSALAALFPVNFLAAQAGLFSSLLRLIRARRISAIRASDPLYCGLFGLALARTTGVPFLVRVNCNNVRVRKTTGRAIMPRLFRFSAIERAVERFVLARADWVFAPNDDNLQFALSSGVPAAKASITSFGGLLDSRHFVPAAKRDSADSDLAELGLGPEPFMLLIGRLIPPKYPDHAVRVADHLLRNGVAAKLVLVGSGEMEDELRSLVRSLGIEQQVVFAGDRDQEWLWRVLPRAALVLSPSTGRALSEAALAAAPIVAYDTDWQKDLIENEKTGVLITYGEWHAMAEAAVTLLTNNGLARRLGAGARARAMDMLDPIAARSEERSVFAKLLRDRALLPDGTDESERID